MEILIGVAAGLIVACACIVMYRKGVCDGYGMQNGEVPEMKPVEIPRVFAKKNKDAGEEDNSLESQLEAFVNYQPKFVEDRNADR